MNPHNIGQRELDADFVIADPGNGMPLACLKNRGHFDIVTAAAETRTVTAPAKSGLALTIAMKTDGGDCVITLPAAANAAGNTTITLNDVGDFVGLRSYDHGGTFRWKLVSNDGATLG